MVEGAPSKSRPEEGAPRIKSWLARGGSGLAWLVPVAIVAITGALGALVNPFIVAVWLAAVGAGTVGVVTQVALEPAPYALRTAQATATVAGIVLLSLLSWQSGHPILR